jgi:hypothetical protein
MDNRTVPEGEKVTRMPVPTQSASEALDEAVSLFRENEELFGDVKQDKEKANLYRGLAAMAEALRQIVIEREGER